MKQKLLHAFAMVSAIVFGCAFAQVIEHPTATLVFPIGDGKFILSYTDPFTVPYGYLPPQNLSFITPPPSMKYIMLPTHKPSFYQLPWGYPIYERPVIVLYPYLLPAYPLYWWDCKPSLWFMLSRPPLIIIFHLSKANAEDVAKRLKESQILPMVRFMASGDKLIVVGPQEVLTGVGQARIREMIKAIDETSQPTQRSGNKVEVTGRKVKVEVYLATQHDEKQSATQVPQDVSEVAKALGMKSVRALCSNECELSLQKPSLIKWESDRTSALKEASLRGSLKIKPIAFDDDGTLMNVELNAYVALPRSTTLRRYTANTDMLCEAGKPTIVVSNHAPSCPSLILRILH
ncbi:MAG: hypothetical protein RUDDFDWM_001633 [Candidatus Fervidibacterota bacterium]